jgi:Zn-finger nucleic acid-binding protein
MGRAMLKPKKGLVCPACRVAIHFRHDKHGVGTCPHCGEWLMQHGRWNRRLEQFDDESSTDFDESDDWEKSLIDEIG